MQYLLLAAVLSLSACAGKTTTTNRFLSSTSAEGKAESVFENLDKDNPEAASASVLSYFSKLRKIYYRSEAALMDFDLMLESKGKSFDLLSSSEYRDNMALWQLKEQTLDEIIHIYRKLANMRYENATFTQRQQKWAKHLLNQFSLSLRAEDDADRLIYSDLVMRLREVRKESKRTKHGEEKDVEPAFASSKELVSAVVRTRPFFQKLGRQEKNKMDDVGQELLDIKNSLPVADDRSRSPQSLRVYPSPGADGNLTGNTFPRGTWALTYDDGPSSKHTLMNLKNLQDNGIKATFFWLAKNVTSLSSVVASVKAAGMTLANHSYTHANLPTLGDSGLQHEIVDSTNVEEGVYGAKPKFFRCPYGACASNSSIRQYIANQGMIHVFWNVDTLDWQDHDPSSILARTQKQMAAQGRGIVLFHDIHPQTVEASRMLMESTKGSVRWVTMQEITDELNGGAVQ